MRLFILVRVRRQLNLAARIAQVDENQPAEVAAHIDPSRDSNFLSNVLRTEFARVVRASE
jgi:hypothetical protein